MNLKNWIKKHRLTRFFFKWLEKYLHVYRLSIPVGHFYSPIPNSDDIKKECETALFDILPDIPWSGTDALTLFKSLFVLWSDFEIDMIKKAPKQYKFENIYFSGMDAFVLYAMIRQRKPRRIFEVGSGYSSALILDTVKKYYGQDDWFRLVCIEPYPERLKSQIGETAEGVIEIIPKKVQEIDAEFFTGLEGGDFLFIDSSHVLKAGSDVAYIFFNILPRLNKGVWVHFHDIFWPFTYPEAWFKEGRFWNEAYFLRVFLQNNDTFSAKLSNAYVLRESRLEGKGSLPESLKSDASSFWIEKIKSPQDKP